jgi:hypothetical protein
MVMDKLFQQMRIVPGLWGLKIYNNDKIRLDLFF